MGRLLLRLGLLGAGVGLTALTVLLAVPDASDYPRATIDKHARLAMDVPAKIVFVGGSNLAYGLDSALIERELGIHVVNMGMNSNLGLRFLLAEITPHLRRGDVVVLSPEYELYFMPVDGIGEDLLSVVKYRPASLRFMTWAQRWRVVKGAQVAIQQKLVRLARTAAGRPHDPTLYFMERLGTRAGFNAYGDFVRHLDVTWPYALVHGVRLGSRPVDEGAVELLARFGEAMERQGVQLFLVPPPVSRSYYEQEKETIHRAHARVRERVRLEGPSGPERYTFPDTMFFDGDYHLRAEARALRTRRVIEDLRPHLAGLDGRSVTGPRRRRV